MTCSSGPRAFRFLKNIVRYPSVSVVKCSGYRVSDCQPEVLVQSACERARARGLTPYLLNSNTHLKERKHL